MCPARHFTYKVLWRVQIALSNCNILVPQCNPLNGEAVCLDVIHSRNSLISALIFFWFNQLLLFSQTLKLSSAKALVWPTWAEFTHLKIVFEHLQTFSSYYSTIRCISTHWACHTIVPDEMLCLRIVLFFLIFSILLLCLQVCVLCRLHLNKALHGISQLLLTLC